MFLITVLLFTALQTPAASVGANVPAARETDPGLTMPGREADARVARIGYRLAVGGRARCPAAVPVPGLVLQHLSQFQLADRAGVTAVQPFDRGPGVIVVVPAGAAAAAGVRVGDVLLAVNGMPVPPEPGLAEPFDAARARDRADAVDDLLERPGPVTVTLLRDGAPVLARIEPRAACPSRIRLARSGQRNAYADGRHVFLTTGLLARLRSDDELAFVLAHEMAHNILGHAAAMRSGGVGHGIGRGMGRSGRIVRAAERAADALAGELMLDTGFDPVAGAAVLERLDGEGLGPFADHDAAGRRVAAMRALVQARRGS